MTEPRKSTVYDFSDLRLHPNGTRVYQKSTNLRPKLARTSVQVARSNWIARDAGGSAKVPLFKKRKRAELEDEEEENKDGTINDSGEDSPVEVDDDKKGKRKSKRPDQRKAKRQKFLKTDDYLAGVSSSDVGGPSDMNSSSLPHPSPDLLKCIHRFASKFYSDRGQLLNSSRQYRIERKERRMKRAVDRDSSPSSHSSSSSESRSKSSDKNDGYEDESDEGASEGDDPDDMVGTKRRKRRKGRRRSKKLFVDMYKVFDGSAMMALGMLVQEHIAHLLKPSIPENWKREICSAYIDPWSDSPQIEDDGKAGKAKQDSPEDGKELQGVTDSVADNGRWRKSPEQST